MQAEDIGRHQLRLIGRFRLTGDDDLAIDITSRRARAIVAYLALSPDRTASRDRLCGLLWGDRGESQARASLRQCLLELRAALAGSDARILKIGRDTIALHADAVSFDVDALVAAIDGDDSPRVASTLDGLGGEGLLADLEIGAAFHDWRDQARTRLDQRIAAGVVAHLKRARAVGDWACVRTLADAYLRRDPLDETAAAFAIRADAALGAMASAHRRFQTIKTALAAEFGVPPGPALLEAFGDLSTAARVAPPAPLAPAGVPAPREDDGEGRREPLIAVLAFDNLSSDRDMDFFSDGISEEILHTIAQTSRLKVIGRSSSFTLRGADKSIDSVVERLRATHILDGSVRRNGDRVRITANLTECLARTNVWSHRFDRDLSDVFGLQDEIAAAVAEALRTRFVHPARSSPVDPETYDLYLRAKTPSPFRLAGDIDMLEEVVRRAPDFVDAWEWLATSTAVGFRWGPTRPANDGVYQRAKSAVEGTLRLKPTSGVACAALVLLAPVAGAFLETENRLRAALKLNPNDSHILLPMSSHAYAMGRRYEAVEWSRRAYEMAPLDFMAVGFHALTLAHADRQSDADALFDEALERWPTNGTIKSWAIVAAGTVGNWTRLDALAAVGDNTGYYDTYINRLLRYFARVRDWRPRFADDYVAAAERELRNTGTVSLRPLALLGRFGEADRAFDLLERARFDQLFQPEGRLGGDDIGLPVFDDDWSALRADARFMDVCRRFGFCDYWRDGDFWPDCVDDATLTYDFRAEALARASPAQPGHRRGAMLANARANMGPSAS